MSVESTHVRRLEKWAKDMQADEVSGHLSEMEKADLRSLRWAAETLRGSVTDAMSDMIARSERYQADRRQEFEDRRRNRTALRVLKRLRKIVVSVSDQQALASIDQYLKQPHANLGTGKADGQRDLEAQ